jgi:putative tricarboxylic transport membrane protein
MRVSDRVSGSFLVALGALAAFGGTRLPPMPGQQIGPSVFPIVVGIGLALCGAMIALGIGHRFEEEAEADVASHIAPEPVVQHGWLWGLRALIPPALLLFYVLASEDLGFVPTAAILALILGLVLGARLRLALPVAIAAPLVIHFLFAKLLRVALPPGVLPMPW